MSVSAKEWVRMRSSETLEEQRLSAFMDLTLNTWFEVIEKYPDYSSWVAHNKTVPLEVLKLLAKKGDAKTRSTVANKGKINLEILEILANDPDESIRRSVMNHRKASKELVTRFINDSWDVVAEEARERLANWKD